MCLNPCDKAVLFSKILPKLHKISVGHQVNCAVLAGLINSICRFCSAARSVSDTRATIKHANSPSLPYLHGCDYAASCSAVDDREYIC
jgi:hypothetical protein